MINLNVDENKIKIEERAVAMRYTMLRRRSITLKMMMKAQRSLRFHFENIVETFEVGIFRHPVLGFGSEFVDESATQHRLEHSTFVIVPEMYLLSSYFTYSN